jgi:hypothetical protein
MRGLVETIGEIFDRLAHGYFLAPAHWNPVLAESSDDAELAADLRYAVSRLEFIRDTDADAEDRVAAWESWRSRLRKRGRERCCASTARRTDQARR